MLEKKEFSNDKNSLVKNILLIGATGYIGGALCRKLHQSQILPYLRLYDRAVTLRLNK
jgi:nucleoside-diphosphate-sugar epimerase